MKLKIEIKERSQRKILRCFTSFIAMWHNFVATTSYSASSYLSNEILLLFLRKCIPPITLRLSFLRELLISIRTFHSRSKYS